MSPHRPARRRFVGRLSSVLLQPGATLRAVRSLHRLSRKACTMRCWISLCTGLRHLESRQLTQVLHHGRLGLTGAPMAQFLLTGGAKSSFHTSARSVNLNTGKESNDAQITLPILLLAFAGAAFAADMQEGQVIELKDGGKIVIEKQGTMVHLDAAGNRVRMKDGQVMEAKDGSKLMMKNNALWKTLTEHGTLKPGHN